jgi:hypothetical protein
LKANIYRKLTAVGLRLCLDSLSVLFFDLAEVPSILFVVYALKIDSNNLAVLRLSRFLG